jgi:hypothetical protein
LIAPSCFFWNISEALRRLGERELGREALGAERVGVHEQRHGVADPALHVRLAHAHLDLLVERGEHRQGSAMAP